MAKIKAYEPIDIHKGNGWPSPLPPLEADEARRAVKRLWRFGMGETLSDKRIHITSGNRHTYWRHGMQVNPEKGWADMIHGLSHAMVDLANTGNAKVQGHSKHHARFEAKLIGEVLKRGWLDGRLKTEPLEQTHEDKVTARREAKLASIVRREAAWSTKLKRAQTALKKIAKEKRAAEKLMSAPIKATVERKPYVKPPTVREIAAKWDIGIERLHGGGHMVYPASRLPEEHDPHAHDHCAYEWSDVRAMVKVYAELTEKLDAGLLTAAA